MVTSNKLLDKKVVKMAEHNNSVVVVPQRTLLGEVNEHIMCPLCRGYYIDATTIVECLHSFCRSCIIKHLRDKSYCPVCEMMINSAKPNIKLDKALQDIVYKLVPGLFQKEMERRQQFYASRPGPAASATPEQRGEDTERIIFSPEDVISFSLEYIDGTDTDSISSKSSDSNESQHVPATTRRYLQCPAVVNISHLKKFLCMKFDIDTTQFDIDILYKRVPLPDYYTLMDIAYIYNWKRNEPMRFFYQIIDYIAIRNRLFDINSKGSHFQDRKSSPASTEDINICSPAANLNDQGSEASSGTDSPMPEENIVKQTSDHLHSNFNLDHNVKDCNDKTIDNKDDSCKRSVDDDVEKSQFLISFELTAKSNNSTVKSPDKASTPDDHSNDSLTKNQTNLVKIEEKPQDSLKRKFQSPPNTPELKKLKIDSDKAKISNSTNSPTSSPVTTMSTTSSGSQKVIDTSVKIKDTKAPQNSHAVQTNNISTLSSAPTKEAKQQGLGIKQHVFDASGLKRTLPQNSPTTTKRKPTEVATAMQQPQSVTQKNVSPLKQVPQSSVKPVDAPKPNLKKMPELKPSVPPSQSSQIKNQMVNKVRMDLLANNSDPTIDRSKILSQVKTSLSNQSTSSGDPLKSLFDSCKINIPSSLSITLTDQKLEPRNPIETVKPDPKKSVVNKNLSSSSGLSHKVPCPPVHNYIEILKLPDTDSKKTNKSDGNSDLKLNQQNKMDTLAQGKSLNKSSESSAKGPVPNLKPISDTKLAKQSGTYSSPITFQQTFEQQLQTLQSDKKSKLLKMKAQVPKLVPATPKSFNAKPSTSGNKNTTIESKPSAALDLSTQTFDKAFETMQSIANLAKKQNLPAKGMPVAMSQSNVFTNMTRPLNTGVNPLGFPSTSNMNQMKIDKIGTSSAQGNINKQDTLNKSNTMKPANNNNPTITPSYQTPTHSSSNATQPSPRSQTRSPSSSPKLVIAEDKQVSNPSVEHNINQSNQITSTQLANINVSKNESPKPIAGPSKAGLKPLKPLSSAGKFTGMRQPIVPALNPNPPNMNNPNDYLRPQLMNAHVLLRQHMEWIKQRQYDFDLYKNTVTNMAHQNQNDFNNKDNKQ